MRQSHVEKEEFWDFVLSEHAQSGLSISEFCRREGVSQASFYQWRKRLAAPAAKSTSCGPSETTSFIPVEVVAQLGSNSGGERSPVQSSNAASLTIRTPQGYVIDVTADTSFDVLQCSLRALQQLASEVMS